MSYTSMCALNAQGELLQEFTFKNAFHGAMHVWASVQKRHFPDDQLLSDETLQRVWDTSKDQAQPTWLRVTMLSTFDEVLVRPADLATVAGAYREFARQFGPGSLLDQATGLETLAGLPDLHAVGWCQTSVIDNPWLRRDESGESRAFDFEADPHWFLFDEFPELSRP